MKNVIDIINNHITVAEIRKEKCTESVNRAFWDGIIVGLNELKSEILNEAVVCGSEKSFTWCKECESHRWCNVIEKCKDK